MRPLRDLGSKGMALTIVMIIAIILALLAGYATNSSFNQRKVVDNASGHRAKVYYCAQAGVVDANWRIRSNYTTDAGTYNNNAYDPPPYTLDVDGNGVADCSVDIGPVVNAAKGNRQILSTGLDV